MASTASILRLGKLAHLGRREYCLEGCLVQGADTRAALLRSRPVGSTLFGTHPVCSRQSGIRAEFKRVAWGCSQDWGARNEEKRGRRQNAGGQRDSNWQQGVRAGRAIGATSEDADRGQLTVVELNRDHKAADNPYGYAWWKVVLAIGVSAVFFYYFNSMETQMHALQAADLPKITVPDKWPWPKLRSSSELEATFRILGDAGRAVYQRYLGLDFLFPLAYTVLYSQFLGFFVVWSQFWARLPRMLFPAWIGSLAYTVFPFDLLENLAILYVLRNPGTAAAAKVATAAGYFTWAKFLLVVVNVSFMYMGLLLGVFDFVFKLLRKRYDGFSAVIYSLGRR